ncbi:protein-export chaperone SecB [Pediococcus pentosaceus]|uniref:protein-export chaperone SecB n=1 Tax=Pediococcus pentosaceus TaxID=1255 RepID=UPI00259B7666|nr:protein-export chaperone SecB [Pediococcus pentosaceus]MDV6381052.1 protein-export chaperone SecB [Pediococcus pentosaceus]WFC01146.1 protein-export chaperone SecB [Pediococcus pentosaceus]
MTKNPKPVINLESYKIADLRYTKDEDEIKKYKSDFEFTPTLAFSKDKKVAKLTIRTSIKINKNKYIEDCAVSLILNGFFEISDDIKNDEKKVASLVITNGTAILFPYVRSIVSMVSGLDSNQTILLPTINTTKLFNN